MIPMLTACCLALLPCPQEPDLSATMQQLAKATTALERAIDAHDAGRRSAELDVLAAALATLRTQAPLATEPATAAILAELGAAVTDLRNPGADAAATDAYDLARLRSSCTRCHLQSRDGNAERGLFPNRGGALSGTLVLQQQDGTPLADRSGLVVFLEGPGLKSPPLPRKPAITQRGRSFQPAVLAVPVGTTVRFPNDDVVFHNVFSLSKGNAFDLDVYGKGVEKERQLGTPGLVRVHCNIHPDMSAHVLVLESAFASVTTASGFWAVPDVPPGDYTLRVWHPLAAPQQQPVRITADTALDVALTVRETKPRVQHTDKFGRPYKKY